MPTVTGTLSDIGLGNLAAFNPVLQFAPSEPAASPGGRIFPTRPVEVIPNSAGAFTVNLASTEGIIPRRAHWVLSIGWRNPDGYMSGAGYFAKDFPTWPIRVPAGGGQLVDMLDVAATIDMIYVGVTPPHPDTGYLFWIDISGETPVLKREQ